MFCFEQIYSFIRADISTIYRGGLYQDILRFKFFNLIFTFLGKLRFRIYAIKMELGRNPNPPQEIEVGPSSGP